VRHDHVGTASQSQKGGWCRRDRDGARGAVLFHAPAYCCVGGYGAERFDLLSGLCAASSSGCHDRHDHRVLSEVATCHLAITACAAVPEAPGYTAGGPDGRSRVRHAPAQRLCLYGEQ
jgi:hypothetical protein